MTHSDENHERPGQIGTEDLMASGGADDRDTPDRTDNVQSEHPSPEGNDRGDLADSREASTGNGSGDRPATPAGQDDGPAALIESSDSARFRNRWHDVQAAFVDDPRRAVSDADQLVAELMESLAAAFSDRKQALEGRWQQGQDAQTEDLRLALRGYRSFFDQLLPH